MKQQRDSNGRFTSSRKSSSKPKNPDCEPATKAYVKCIARKIAYHDHNQIIESIVTAVAAFSAIGSLIVLAIIHIPISEGGYWCLVAIAISCGAVFIDQRLSDGYPTSCAKKFDEEAIQKYIPPEEIKRICDVFNEPKKPKKECEEE